MFINYKNPLIIIEYTFIFKCFLIGLIVSSLLTIISLFLVYQKPDREKMSAYECGFSPFGDARNKFEVKYYLVGILFIIFDLEISYIFPWVICWWHLNFWGIFIMYIFIFLLCVAFVYEWLLGGLDLNIINFKNFFYFFLYELFIKFLWISV